MAEKTTKTQRILVYTATFLLLLILCRLFPYTADDWATGTAPIKWSLPKYNGRYIGHFLEQFTAHYIWLRTILACMTIFSICKLCECRQEEHRITLFLMSLILLFNMPRQMFAQSIVWNSGFTIFGIPTFLSLIYLWLTRNIFNQTAPDYPAWLFIAAGAIGLINAFFVENITILNLLIGALVILIAFIRFKKIHPVHIAFFCGAAIGAFEVFRNPAYSIAANNSDGQYAMAVNNLSGILEKAFENYSLINQYFLSAAILPELLIACVFSFLFISHKQTQKKSLMLLAYASWPLVFAFPIYNSLKLFFPQWQILLSLTAPFDDAFSLAYIFCLFVLLFLFKGTQRGRLLFELLSVGIAAAPLLVISPLTERCLFPSYTLLVYFSMDLAGIMLQSKNQCEDKTLTFSLLAITACFFIFYFSIFSVIWHYNAERTKYVRGKAQRGNQVIAVTRLPYEEYLFGSIPDVPFYKMGFARYHEIDESVELKTVSFEEWLSYMEQE